VTAKGDLSLFFLVIVFVIHAGRSCEQEPNGWAGIKNKDKEKEQRIGRYLRHSLDSWEKSPNTHAA
jgi:hypothetical protein